MCMQAQHRCLLHHPPLPWCITKTCTPAFVVKPALSQHHTHTVPITGTVNVDVNRMHGDIAGVLNDVFPGNGQMKEVMVQGRKWTGFFNDWQARDRLRRGMRNPINLNIGGRVHGKWFGVFEG